MGRSLDSSAPPPPSLVGRSTAQAGLAKILAFISVLTSPHPPKKPLRHHRRHVDLTLRLGPALEPPAPLPADSSEGECDTPREAAAEAAGKESSEITTSSQEVKKEEEKKEAGVQEAAPEPEATSEAGGQRSERGYLDLLLAAVHEVLGGFFEDKDRDTDRRNSKPPPPSPAPSREVKRKRRKEAAATTAVGCRSVSRDMDEAAPIVRSKRGRNQTLPSRYRDSILEPWTKAPPAPAPYGRASFRH